MGGASVHFSQLTSRLRGEVFDQAIVLTGFVSQQTIVERDDGNLIVRALFSPDSISNKFRRPKLAFNYLMVLLFIILMITLFGVSTVHTQTKRYYEWGTWFGRLIGATVVIDGRDLGSASFQTTGDIFVAASENVVAAAEHRSETIVQVPVGVDFQAFPRPDRETQPIDEEYILYVGDVAKRKGVDALIKAYPLLDADERLVIVGEIIDDDFVELIERTDGVQYNGAVPHDTAIQYIAKANLTVLPSREEAIGRVPIESFIMGTPCACPPDVPEYQEHVPHLVLPGVTVPDIKRTIDKLLSTECLELGYPINRHHVDNTIQQYISIYRRYVD